MKQTKAVAVIGKGIVPAPSRSEIIEALVQRELELQREKVTEQSRRREELREVLNVAAEVCAGANFESATKHVEIWNKSIEVKLTLKPGMKGYPSAALKWFEEYNRTCKPMQDESLIRERIKAHITGERVRAMLADKTVREGLDAVLLKLGSVTV